MYIFKYNKFTFWWKPFFCRKLSWYIYIFFFLYFIYIYIYKYKKIHMHYILQVYWIYMLALCKEQTRNVTCNLCVYPTSTSRLNNCFEYSTLTKAIIWLWKTFWTSFHVKNIDWYGSIFQSHILPLYLSHMHSFYSPLYDHAVFLDPCVCLSLPALWVSCDMFHIAYTLWLGWVSAGP